MKKNILLLMTISSIFIFTGCISKKTVALKPQDTLKFQNKTFTYVKRALPTKPFVMTPTKAIAMSLTGGIGGAVIGYSHNASQIESVKSTPSHFLNTNLANYIKKRYKMKYVDEAIITDKTDIEDLTKLYKTDFLLESRDLMWQVIYFPTHWDTYKVMYSNKLRFIDLKNNNVIAEGYCEYNPEYSEILPSYDLMFFNNAKLVKQYTQEALDQCLKKYINEVLK